MTVSKDYNKHIYEGNGLTVDWPYDFDLPLTSSGDPDTSLIHVYLTDPDGTVTEVTTGYSIDSETGTLTYPTSGDPLESGVKLTILRLLDVRQQFFDPSNQANLYPETLEDNTDRLVMMVQQLQEETDRAVKVSVSTDLETEDITAEGIFEARDIAISAAETAEGWANTLPAIADELDVNLVMDEADLRAKLAAMGASNATLVIATTIPIAEDLTIPSNVALSFKKTGQLQPASGKTLTVNGPVDAGLWQIFGGGGTVTGTPQIPYVYPEWFGAVGDGITDDAAAVQAALDFHKIVQLQDRDYAVLTTLLMRTEGNELRLSHNTGILYTGVTDSTCVIASEEYCRITGGLGRGFVGPDVWNGENSAPGYATIIMNADHCTVQGTRLYNIERVGVWFKDASDCKFLDNLLLGNYPTAQWTGSETGNFGLLIDPNATNPSLGNYLVSGNTFKNTVQGILAGNYGTGQRIQGLAITGNVFEGCWNHGIYSTFTTAATVTGNNFNRCQVSIVISGSHNVISSNTIYTDVDVEGDQRDVAGIDVRDGCYNVVANNTIKGVLPSLRRIAIDVRDVTGIEDMIGNVIKGNTIFITDGYGIGIRVYGTAYTFHDTTIADNVVTIPGQQYMGAIHLGPPTAQYSYGTKVHHNTIRVLDSEAYGIYGNRQIGAVIDNNSVQFDIDAGAALTVHAVYGPNMANTLVSNNVSIVTPSYGTNLTVVGFREITSATNNETRNNVNSVSTAKGATYTPIMPLTDGGLLIDQVHAGAPTSISARVGSRWCNTGGGAGTVFYVKESGTGTAGWVGK